MNFAEILENSKTWDFVGPILEQNELVMVEDLTDNNIVVRQINCTSILDKMLCQELTHKQPV